MSGRRLVANLLFEGDLARAFAARPGAPSHRPRTTPSRAALATAAAYGTLLRAFARDGDRLWLPAPVDPARMPEIPGLPRPILETGSLSILPTCAETLAWGESPEVAALRRREARGAARGEALDDPIHTAPVHAAPAPDALVHAALVRVAPVPGERRGGPLWPPSSDTTPLADALWSLPPAPPDIVARVHHRAFALEVARELGCALPGAARVDSLDALARHLAAGAAPTGRWVLKAPLSASGRDRYIERGANGVAGLADPAVRRRIEGLFATHGALLFEPWMERTDDFGACALLTPEGLQVLGFHRLLVDLRGQFAGIEIAAEPRASGLTEGEEDRFRRTVEEVGAALVREGYTGPFGVDAWRYRVDGGAGGFHLLGEINARLTFGFVARALAERLRAAGVLAPTDPFRLRVGRAAGATLPLVLTRELDAACAWAEVT